MLKQITSTRWVRETDIMEGYCHEQRRGDQLERTYGVVLKNGEKVPVPDYLWDEIAPSEPYKWLGVMEMSEAFSDRYVEAIRADDVYLVEVVQHYEAAGMADYALHLRSRPEPVILLKAKFERVRAMFNRAGLPLPE